MESPSDAAKRISEIVPSSPDGWGVVRCDGTLEELAKYRAGSPEYGWDVRARCSVGDLLLGTVGQGRSRVIINVNRVEGVFPRGVEWIPQTDVPIVPSIGWAEVGARFGRTDAWRRLDGAAALRYIGAVTSELKAASDVPEREGEVRLARCRRRSTKNRIRKLDEAGGVCAGCARNFRVGFGFRGDRALEVHHLKPLSKSGEDVHTKLSELAVLCATCHRLVHADPQLRIDSLPPGWLRMSTES